MKEARRLEGGTQRDPRGPSSNSPVQHARGRGAQVWHLGWRSQDLEKSWHGFGPDKGEKEVQSGWRFLSAYYLGGRDPKFKVTVILIRI